MVDSDQIDFLILTETHITENIEVNEIMLKGYNNIKCNSNSTRTGGVIIYIKNCWEIIKIMEKTVDSKIWLLACKCKYNDIDIVIVAIYRSPSSSERDFCNFFKENIEILAESANDLIIAGDFNIDWRKNDRYKREIESFLNDNYLTQKVNDYTRITRYSKTLIDYVITNMHNLTLNINAHNKISDHEMIDIIINVKNNNTNNSKSEIEIFKYNKDMYTREILMCDCTYNNESDIHENAEKIETILKSTTKKFVNKKFLRMHNNTNRWFNNELRTLKSEKVNKYLIAKLVNTRECWDQYKNARNRYKVKMNNAKSNYINKSITEANGQKQMWRELKNLVLKQNKNKIESVNFDETECKNDLEIAKKFNEYFITSVEKIRDSIADVQYVNNIEQNDCKFKFRAINIDELKSVCKSLKNKPDFNKLSPKIIIDNWNILGHEILKIVNTSLMRGEFPNSWKDSMITPVEKIARTKKCEEFRPINSLKTLEKILEMVIKQQLQKYMEDNKLFSEFQSGFRENYSCETAVNYVINDWKRSGKKKKIMALFLDFKRAFETIDRKLLLKKLNMYGIEGKELKWFSTYLSGRTQRTKVNNAVSDFLINDFGVPQGSILGALLFIIYVNDITRIISHCKIILYADDTLLYAEGNDEKECRTKLMRDIEQLNIWLKMNKLKLNEQKTKLMEINMNSESTFNINGKLIEKVSNIKYLGFIIDSEMKFNDHVEYMCKKIGKKIGFFKRVRKQLSLQTSINLYNVIIKPHFEFCSIILYSCCNKNQLDRLQKLQNKAMRSILKCSRYTPIRSMIDCLKWLNIHQRMELNTLLLVFKIKYGRVPNYLRNNTSYVGDTQPYGLRNVGDFRLQRHYTTAAQHSFFYKGLRLFNSLPDDAKGELNFNSYKKKCIAFVKNK